jgi:predicted metal-dependent peptidase
LNQFKEHLDLKMDIKSWKKLTRAEKTWKHFKSHFTRAINDNKSDTSILRRLSRLQGRERLIEIIIIIIIDIIGSVKCWMSAHTCKFI